MRRAASAAEAARRGCRSHHATSRADGAHRDARIAREPERHGDLAVGARLRRQRCDAASTSRPAALIHCVTVSGAKPSRRCACSLAQEFQVVRREIDDQQPPARAQHARGLADRARAVVEEVQHLMDDHDVEGIRRRSADRRCRPAARCNACRPARSSRARASASMSSDRSMPSPRSMSRAEQFEHAAGAGAEIEQRAERPVGERVADRGLDRRVGDMQLADAVPLGGVLRGNRSAPRRRARRAPRRAARGRARSIGSAGSSRADQRAREVGAAAVLGEAEEGPGALAEALDQPGLGQQLEVARDARLRLAQDLGEVGDRQFGLGQQRQDAQARAPRRPP